MEFPANYDDGADPDELVYEVPYENLKDDEDIYAVVTLGAGGKPRYLLSKIHSMLYTASTDVRRADHGGYVSSSKEKEEARSAKTTVPTASCASSSGAPSSGGLRQRIAGVIQVRFWRNATAVSSFHALSLVDRAGERVCRDGAFLQGNADVGFPDRHKRCALAVL